MNISLPASVMDYSLDSSNPGNAFSIQNASISNFYKSLPNSHILKCSKEPINLGKPILFISELFATHAAHRSSNLDLTNTDSKYFNCLSSRRSPATAEKQHPLVNFGRELAQKINGGKLCLRNAICNAMRPRQQMVPCFGSVSASGGEPLEAKHVFQLALSQQYVSKRLRGVNIYTVCNIKNEFVLISDPNSQKSLGLLCFRQEDANAILAQVQRQPGLSRGAKVVPLSLDKVYTLKVEGIAFRFVPDPVQVRNALKIKSKDMLMAFDGVPVFQSDLVTVWKNNRRFCPLYFCKEDLERDILTVARTKSKSSQITSEIMVGSLEAALKKMKESDVESGWDDLVFIPPGESCSELIDTIRV
ncbi:protein TIC 22, chloroplastic [Cryptomeria japonica]|uniref:protein TIC 22, chloroplastic n=1 Tax=Cryptomeria japonica TaxID=3369 RepID=UPI0027DA0E24|nr:protein TIC 22, chloroplastic [Cryptomeria japonica]XP_057822913.2 protein TIC 22, chloroplastic [Cryptomeria japonica]XP_057822914.2 protein TIC 22, chloroplastic [Cryptomeria japonica]XP_057822915.2 protein TIC 22, chloroplastic [Cryptomeria japonica]